jgi:protein-S-isoprenylcysteine O-methyltransferase Ste14
MAVCAWWANRSDHPRLETTGDERVRRGLSQRLFIAEAVMLCLPLTALLILAVSSVSIPDRSELWPWGAMDLIVVLATVAVLIHLWAETRFRKSDVS